MNINKFWFIVEFIDNDVREYTTTVLLGQQGEINSVNPYKTRKTSDITI